MPKKLMRCVRKVKKQIAAGKMKKGSNAYAICVASTGQKVVKHKKKK